MVDLSAYGRDRFGLPEDDVLWMLGWGFSLRCLFLGHRWFPREGEITVWHGMDELRQVPASVTTCSCCGAVKYARSPAPRIRIG